MVGAGFAGLSAAHELEGSGISVTVLEARERVGGRVWSTTLPNGAVAELGAEWIMAGDEAIHTLASSFGIDLVETGADYGRRVAFGPGAVSLDGQARFLDAADRERRRVSTQDAEAMSLGAFLDRVPGDALARELVKTRLQGTCALDLDRVALGSSSHDGGFSRDGGPFYRAARGNQRLAEALADPLADVRTGQPVHAVERRDHGVTIRAGGAEVSADAAVIAVPAPIAARLSVTPALPEELGDALRELPMGVASKFAVATSDRPTARSLQSTDVSMWCWAANDQDGLPRPCIASFAGSTSAQEILGVDQGSMEPWLERLAVMNPDVTFDGDPLMYAWADDPFTLGAYSAWDGPSLARVDVFSRPVGRLAFAGEHTAGASYHGTMNGAVLSGQRAARQVLDLLR